MPSCRERWGSICGTGVPDTVSVPASACSAPVMILMRVDLPAPFSPTSAWTSPEHRSNETPLSACTPAKDFVMEVASRRALDNADLDATLPHHAETELRVPPVGGRRNDAG